VRVLFVSLLLLLLCHALARDVVHCIVECAQPSRWSGCLALSIAIYITEKLQKALEANTHHLARWYS
jgi:hypothetical protein